MRPAPSSSAPPETYFVYAEQGFVGHLAVTGACVPGLVTDLRVLQSEKQTLRFHTRETRFDL